MKKLFAEMGHFNEQRVKAGIVLAGDGLQPSSQGQASAIVGRR